MAALREQGVEGEVVRVADHDVRPGVVVDMGEGDAWPAMEGTDYQDLDTAPDPVASTTRTLAANSTHLARLLRGAPYPPG